MRVLIQHKETGRFLAGDGTWVPEAEQALSFGNTLFAIDHCWASQTFDVFLLLKAEDPSLDTHVEVFGSTTKGIGRW